jgi:hypothetical protein
MGTRYRISSTSTLWNTYTGGDGEGCGISQANTAVIIYSYVNGVMYCSFDSGNTIDYCNNGLASALEESYPFTTNLETPSASSDPTGTVFLTYSAQSVYMSSVTNGVLSWRRIGRNGVTPGLASTLFRITYHAIGVGTLQQIAVCKSNGVAVSTNGGSTWLDVVLTNTVSSWRPSTSPLYQATSFTAAAAAIWFNWQGN